MKRTTRKYQHKESDWAGRRIRRRRHFKVNSEGEVTEQKRLPVGHKQSAVSRFMRECGMDM